jgi:hypothetical protein
MTQGGGEVVSTGDIPPNGHGELSIMSNATESLQYHCENHTLTMLGDIRITNATTTMTNNYPAVTVGSASSLCVSPSSL